MQGLAPCSIAVFAFIQVIAAAPADVDLVNKTNSLSVTQISRDTSGVTLIVRNDSSQPLKTLVFGLGPLSITRDFIGSGNVSLAPKQSMTLEIPLAPTAANTRFAAPKRSFLDDTVILKAAVFSDQSSEGEPAVISLIFDDRNAKKAELERILARLHTLLPSHEPLQSRLDELAVAPPPDQGAATSVPRDKQASTLIRQYVGDRLSKASTLDSNGQCILPAGALIAIEKDIRTILSQLP